MVKLIVLNLLFLTSCLADQELRGVPPSKLAFYNSKSDFTCLDKSLKVPFTKVNDDYCDCPDGSDEPGTSACPNGSYFCHNTGYESLVLPSSRVNDGICDCCDGTDEHASGASCKNLCADLATKAEKEAERLQQIRKKARAVKEGYIERGKSAKAAGKERLAVLLADKILAESVKVKLEKEKTLAEEREKLALNEHQQTAVIGKDSSDTQNEKPDEEALMYFESLDTDRDGKLQVHEIQSVLAFDLDEDGTITEAEVQFFFHGRQELERENFLSTGWPAIKAIVMNQLEIPNIQRGRLHEEKRREILVLEGHQQVALGEDSSDTVLPLPNEKSDKEELMYFESFDTNRDGKLQVHEIQSVLAFDLDKDGTVTEAEAQFFFHGKQELEHFLSTGWPAIKAIVMNQMMKPNIHRGKSSEDSTERQKEYDPELQAVIDDATKARDAYEAAERRILDIEQEIQDLTRKQHIDYGQQDEYQPLEGQCFEYTDREYTYKLCPFNYVSQSPKDGGSETRLGSWGSWNGSSANKYSVMQFDKGEQCWNGPQRSTKVSLSCGLDNTLSGVSEPSRCEYAMKFSTPAACDDPQTEESSGQSFYFHEEL